MPLNAEEWCGAVSHLTPQPIHTAVLGCTPVWRSRELQQRLGPQPSPAWPGPGHPWHLSPHPTRQDGSRCQPWVQPPGLLPRRPVPGHAANPSSPLAWLLWQGCLYALRGEVGTGGIVLLSLERCSLKWAPLCCLGRWELWGLASINLTGISGISHTFLQ